MCAKRLNLCKVKAGKPKLNKIEALRFQAANALCLLRDLAKTDIVALEVLATELRHHVKRLNYEALESPEHYHKLIRRCASWPGAVSVDKDVQNWHLSFARVMELGADAPLNYTNSKRRWSRSTVEIVATLHLIDWIERRGDKLPPLTRLTAGQWWKHARPLFTQLYGEQFEEHPLFKKKYGSKDIEDDSLKIKTARRKQILSKMQQAFHSIARKP
jgi:hypothetical protein